MNSSHSKVDRNSSAAFREADLHTLVPATCEIRIALFLLYALVTAILIVVLTPYLADPAMHTSLLLVGLLGLAIVAVVVLRRSMDLAEPIYWFSIMYYLIVPGATYLLVTGFSGSEHLLDFSTSKKVQLANLALLLLILGYIAFTAGYFSVLGRGRRRLVRLPTEKEVSGWIAHLAIACAIGIGTLNFIYMITSYPGGWLDYLLNFGLRSYRFELFEKSVSTFGYQFLYAGVLFWYVILLRTNKMSFRHGEFWLFALALAFSLVVSISQGRMSQTVTYLLVLGFLGQTLAPEGQSNIKAIAWTGLVALVGIVLYFYRKVSVAIYTGKDPFSVSQFWQDIAYWLVDKGNIPNLPVLMNILADHGINGEFWMGRSYATALAALSDSWGETSNVGQALGAQWFGQSGGLPPTVIGEAYVNFGLIGVPLVLVALGAGSAWLYKFVRERGSFIWYVVYFALLFRFIFILPKGETANIVSALWMFIPAVAIYLLVRLISELSAYDSGRLKERVST